MAEHRMVTVTHSAISEWDWPAITMDFIVSESIDLSALSKGTQLHMEITKSGTDRYEITEIHIKDNDDGATNQSPVTQSNRPMSSMLDDVQSDRIALNQATNTQKANAEDPEHSYQQHSGM